MILPLLFSVALAQSSPSYPPDWFAPVAESERHTEWGEVLPQDAKPGEVIVSKRTALGVFSNLWATPFDMDGVHYASLEGLWQMMKYPEDSSDPRAQAKDWPYTRNQVQALSMWDAKHAGDTANRINQGLGVHWISYFGERFDPKDHGVGSTKHYDIILRATREKIRQNPALKDLLLQTRGLKLRMDHKVEPTETPAYQTPDILMKIRQELP